MSIKLMKSDDLEIVIKFEKEYRELDENIQLPFDEDSYREKYKEKRIEDYPNNKTFLFVDKDKIIGRIDTLVEINLGSFKKVGYIDWITVLKTHRNKGIAKALFMKAEAYFRIEKCDLFYLFVDDTEIAKGFYKKIQLKQENVTRGFKELK